MSEYDENVIYMPFHAAQEYFLVDEGASGIEVNGRRSRGCRPPGRGDGRPLGPQYTFVTWKKRNEAFFSALAVERNVMFIILSLIILVAALNIISGLIMLVKDKSHDIAILRTMGASRGAVQRVFLITGASIGVVGTLAGFVLGVAGLPQHRKHPAVRGLAHPHQHLPRRGLLSLAASRRDGPGADRLGGGPCARAVGRGHALSRPGAPQASIRSKR